jgi:hypothetical protein
MRCNRCQAVASKTWSGRPLCGYCHGRLVSVLTHCGRVYGEALGDDLRDALWTWFLTTRYFSAHRRMSRGRAKRLITFMAASVAMPSVAALNESSQRVPRGPHDLVVDGVATTLPTYPPPLGINPNGGPLEGR